MGYQSLYRSNDYHIINGKDASNFEIVPNPNQYTAAMGNTYIEPKKGLDFMDYKNRVPIASAKYPPNEKRFDNINKNPRISTTHRH